MLIDGMVNQYNQSMNVGKGRQGAPAGRMADRAEGASQASLSGLSKGQLFEGTVSGIKGNQVTLSLTSGENVKARLAEDVQLTEGESVFFEVKSNDGAMVQIRPVSMGVLNNPALMQALDIANLPTTEKNVNMVNAMMSEQLPIDAASLTDMSRAMALHPDTDIETLVTMQKVGLPINDSMIEQFSNYKSSEGAIMNSVMELADSMVETFSSPAVGTGDITSFFTNLTNILTAPEGEVAPMVDALGNWQLPEGVEITGEGMSDLFASAMEEYGEDIAGGVTDDGLSQAPQVLSDVSTEASEEPVKTAEDTDQTSSASVVGAEDESADISKTANSQTEMEKTAVRTETQAQNEASVDHPSQRDEVLASAKNEMDAVGNKLDSDSLKSLAGELKRLNIDLSSVTDEKGSIKPDVKASDLMKLVSSQLAEKGDLSKQDLINVFKSDKFKAVISTAMQNRWTLSPEEVGEKENIKKLYAKISSDMERISQAATAAAKGANPISGTADSARANVDFINHINEAYTYVQLPLKMAGQSATGDMYVFTNKKNRYEKGDEVSAFLHFDMDNLGSTDISVKLQNKKVQTKFFLDDPAAFDLIEKNLPRLQEKLESLGYSCRISVENEDNPVDFVEDFLKQDAPSKGGIISRYSFDMKA